MRKARAYVVQRWLFREDCYNAIVPQLLSVVELESVQLDRALGDTLLCQERGYFEPLISLELDYLTKFVIVDKSTVASKFLPTDQKIRIICYVMIKMTKKPS